MITTIFCPILAKTVRDAIDKGAKLAIIPKSDFPPGTPKYDRQGHLAIFAVPGNLNAEVARVSRA